MTHSRTRYNRIKIRLVYSILSWNFALKDFERTYLIGRIVPSSKWKRASTTASQMDVILPAPLINGFRKQIFYWPAHQHHHKSKSFHKKSKEPTLAFHSSPSPTSNNLLHPPEHSVVPREMLLHSRDMLLHPGKRLLQGKSGLDFTFQQQFKHQYRRFLHYITRFKQCNIPFRRWNRLL